MRVTQAGFYNQAAQQLGKQQAKVFETQAQLSSGKNILKPSDDPALATSINKLKSQIDVNQRYLTNLERMQDTLKMQESSITNAVDVVARIKELGVQGANDTYNASDRKSIAIEVGELISSLTDLGNMRGTDGAYLFSGYSQGQPPFSQSSSGVVTYTGSTDALKVMVDEGRSMQLGVPGSDVFGTVVHQNQSTGTTSRIELFSTLSAMHEALVTNDSDGIRSGLDKVTSVHEHIITQQSNIGSRMQRIETLTHAVEDRDYTYKILQSNMEDLDYVEAASRLKTQSLALQAGQQTFTQLSELSLFKYIR
ncbi:flagellar hook-associated protein FlgL [Oceanospirillaceae bacterium]|jgi:flagellar hook-associated protein 3 FlgL|nr:flagellar hook-associated protein FlgL [Oceanospirillaceae bacterium]